MPGLEREMSGEKEALLESLKTGQSYFAVSEWRAIADLSKEVPQIRKEAVKREQRDNGLAPPLHMECEAGRRHKLHRQTLVCESCLELGSRNVLAGGS